LRLLSGRRHRVFTGIAIRAPNGKQAQRVVTSIVGFARLDAQQLANYLASQEWLGKAGGYAIQGKAAAFIDYLSGSIPTSSAYRFSRPPICFAGWAMRHDHDCDFSQRRCCPRRDRPIALLNGDRLTEYSIWHFDQPGDIGDVYSGRITARLPAMAGSFVDLGTTTGFLPDSAGAADYPKAPIFPSRSPVLPSPAKVRVSLPSVRKPSANPALSARASAH